MRRAGSSLAAGAPKSARLPEQPENPSRGSFPALAGSSLLTPPVSMVLSASFASLPLDLVVEIVSRAPFLARLRTLSFVCKRWRKACLRSVRKLRFRNHRVDSETPADGSDITTRFNSLVALFPSLDALHLCDEALLFVQPPTSLTSLRIDLKDHVVIELLAQLEADETRGTLFSCDVYPQLTKLRLCLHGSVDTTRLEFAIACFVSCHTALTTLRLELFTISDVVMSQLARASMPRSRACSSTTTCDTLAPSRRPSATSQRCDRSVWAARSTSLN